MSNQPSPPSLALEPAAREEPTVVDRLIVALDFPSATRSFEFLEELAKRSGQPPRWVKIGLELFLSEGAALVSTLREQGYRVFLDLKLHDIPNTVAGAIRSLAPLEVELLTVHALGGPAMMEAAVEAAAALSRPPRLLAVTVLTSMNAGQLRDVGILGSPADQAFRLARAAWKAGLRGLVASPLEAAMLRQEFGTGLHLVTPGVRLHGDSGGDDQQRVGTPSAALRAGASQLVIGRPITRAADPVAAYESILAEMAG